MKNKTKIKRLFFIAIVFLVVTWIASTLLFWLVGNRDQKNFLLIDEITEQTDRREEIRTLARDTENLREKMVELDKLFIGNNQEEVVKFIEDIESISEISGTELVISEVKISSLKDEVLTENFEYVDLRLGVEGSWAEVFHFLNLLENLSHHIIFRQSKLSLVSDGEGVIGWKGYFDFSVSRIK